MLLFRTFLVSLAAALLFTPSALAQNSGLSDEELVRVFSANPDVLGPALSPDGRRLAFYRRDANNTPGVFTYEITEDGAVLTGAVGFDPKVADIWVLWLNNDRLLIGMSYKDSAIGTGGVMQRNISRRYRQGAERIADKNFAEYASTVITRTRLMSGHYDLSDVAMVEVAGNRTGGLQIADEVIDLLPADPDGFLMIYGDPDRKRVKLMMPANDDEKLISSGRRDIGDWMADRNGVLRIGWGEEVSGELEFFKQATTDSKLKDVSDIIEDLPPFVPLGIGEDPDLVYVMGLNESGYRAIFGLDLKTLSFTDALIEIPDYDVENVIWSRDRTRIIGVRYAVDAREVKFIDPDLAASWDMIRQQYGSGDLLEFIDVSANGDAILYQVSGHERPGELVIFRPDPGILMTLADIHSALADAPLGRQVSARYSASDGADIPAYVTLPPGITSLEEAKDLPFVVLPHGGPYARDYLEFDRFAQFIAAQGYGILQMNFRGSVGYGESFRQAGVQEWGGLMQSDIRDGTRWLIDQGYADPGRICIVGWSFGGYAALQNARNTDLFQCSASIAGVSDLRELINQGEYIHGRQEYLEAQVGLWWKDRSRLRQESPAENTEEVNVPVLLIHGRRDAVVPREQSELMEQMMKRENKPVKYVEIASGDHYMRDQESREILLRELSIFLAEHLRP